MLFWCDPARKLLLPEIASWTGTPLELVKRMELKSSVLLLCGVFSFSVMMSGMLRGMPCV